jgi:hypothetical protein
VIQGDIRRITHPKRVSEYVGIHAGLRAIALDKFLLSVGAFAGKPRACHLRLLDLHEDSPQFCLRFDGYHRWVLCGLGGRAFVRGEVVGDAGVPLEEGDEIICDPYILKVIPKPTLAELAAMTEARIESDTATSSLSDTNFVLNMPPIILRGTGRGRTDRDRS